MTKSKWIAAFLVLASGVMGASLPAVAAAKLPCVNAVMMAGTSVGDIAQACIEFGGQNGVASQTCYVDGGEMYCQCMPQSCLNW